MSSSSSPSLHPFIGTVVGSHGCSQDYTILHKLGKGVSGVVYQARGSADGQLYAVKLFSASIPSDVPLTIDEIHGVFQSEVNKLQQLRASGCPHLSKVIDFWTEPADTTATAPDPFSFPRNWMVLDFADKGNLEGLL